MTAYPEWLTRQDDEASKWSVRNGQPHMAHTDVGNHTMIAPGGDDPVYRGVRLQQLLMAKVAPKEYLWDRYYYSPVVLQAAQQMLTNRMMRQMGEDLDFMHTGAEFKRGQLLARNEQWNEIVTSLAPIYGTRAGDELLAGIADVKREWSTLANEHLKRVQAGVDYWDMESLTDTSETEFSDKSGDFFNHPNNWRLVQSVADSLQNSMMPQPLAADIAPGKPRNPPPPNRNQGRWAAMVLSDVTLEGRAKGVHSRKPRASDIGRVPRNISRLLFDPQKRIFGHRRRDLGGVVLIDQSGSMHLDHADLWNIIQMAPGATIIGYSHIPGTTDQPNVWVMAEKGRVVKEADMPYGGSGNCVDGPALAFAATKRRNASDPFVWVCDGLVTDLHDQYRDNLTLEAIDMARSFGTHMCNDIDTALMALAAAAKGKRLGVYLTGRLSENDPYGNDYPPRPYATDDSPASPPPYRDDGDDDECDERHCYECGAYTYDGDLCETCAHDDDDDEDDGY